MVSRLMPELHVNRVTLLHVVYKCAFTFLEALTVWPSSVKEHFTGFIAGTPAYGELSQSSGGDAPMVRNALCGMDRSARDGTVRDSPWTRPWIVYEELV